MTTRLQAMRHRDLTDAVHAEGGAIALQVLHAGRYGYHPFSVSASTKKSPITPFKTERAVDQGRRRHRVGVRDDRSRWPARRGTTPSRSWARRGT